MEVIGRLKLMATSGCEGAFVYVCVKVKERVRNCCYCAVLGSTSVMQVVHLCALLLIASSVNVTRSNSSAI